MESPSHLPLVSGQEHLVCTLEVLTREANPQRAEAFPPKEKTQMSPEVGQGSFLWWKRHEEGLEEALVGKQSWNQAAKDLVPLRGPSC